MRALSGDGVRRRLEGRPLTVVAAGKAADPMASAFLDAGDWRVSAGLIASPHGVDGGRDTGVLERFVVGHPLPDAGSAAAGARVLELAGSMDEGAVLVVLLSGGASAALAAPIAGVTLDEKMVVSATLLRAGVPIHALNCVRKHLSRIKGGRLAAAARGAVVTLAVSDVVGPIPDDPAVIGSGPTVADPTRFADALAVVEGLPETPPAVLDVCRRGADGALAETPKPGDPRLARARMQVIGTRHDALEAARGVAERLGYAVTVVDEPIVGEAHVAAPAYLERVGALVRRVPRPVCVLSSGETTVHVRGDGRGGRNQEFALATVTAIGERFERAALASVGTDGVDGPTSAAGAVVDVETMTRAKTQGLAEPARYLESNDSFTFFHAMDDLIETGPTDTNVGDLQILLID